MVSSRCYYHVTESRNLQSILRRGLLPRVGPRSKELGEPYPAVYLFASLDDVQTALEQWLGDAYDETPDGCLIVLEVSLGEDQILTTSAGYEVMVVDPIAPERITRILNEELTTEIQAA